MLVRSTRGFSMCKAVCLVAAMLVVQALPSQGHNAPLSQASEIIAD